MNNFMQGIGNVLKTTAELGQKAEAIAGGPGPMTELARKLAVPAPSRNYWDQGKGLWIDRETGNQYDPNEGVWRSADRSMKLDGDVWRPEGPTGGGTWQATSMPPSIEQRIASERDAQYAEAAYGENQGIAPPAPQFSLEKQQLAQKMATLPDWAQAGQPSSFLGKLAGGIGSVGEQGLGLIAQGAGAGVNALASLPVTSPYLSTPAGTATMEPVTLDEAYGVAQMPGQELGQAARENIPGPGGRILGTAAEIALDPLTVAGAGLRGPGLAANLLGAGTLSPARYGLATLGAGLVGGVGQEVGGTPGMIAGALAGGVGGLATPAIARGAREGAEAYGRAALRSGVPEGVARETVVPPALLRTEGSNVPRTISPTLGEGVPATGGGARRKGELPPDDLEAQLAASIEQVQRTRGVAAPAAGAANVPVVPSSMPAPAGAVLPPTPGAGSGDSLAPVPLQAPPSTRTNAAATSRFGKSPVVDDERFRISQLWAKDMPNAPADSLTVGEKRTALYNAGLESIGSGREVTARYAAADAARVRLPLEEPPSDMPDARDIAMARAPQRQAAREASAAGGGAQPPTGPVAPEAASAEVENFINTRRVILADLPFDAGKLRRVGATVSGDLPSPYLAEIVSSETELRQMVTRLTKDVAPDDADAVSLAITTRFREQMLDEKFGADLASRNAASQTLDAVDVERRATGAASDVYDAINDSLRSVVLGMDIAGVVGQQGLRAGRASPAVATGLIGRVLDRAGLAPGIYKPGIDRVSQAMADGLQMGAGGVTADVGKANLLGLIGLDKIPGAKNLPGARFANLGKAADFLSTAQFEKGLGGVRLKAYEGLLLQNKALSALTGGRLGGDITNPQVRRHIAEFANVVGSSARPASAPRRAAIESRALLSPRMTRAQANELLTIPKTIRSQEDAINTLNLIAGTALVFGGAYELNKEIGASEIVTDPLDPLFGRLITKYTNSKGENIIADFLPQASLFRTIAKSVDALGEGDYSRLADAWARFGAGRLGTAASDALRLGSGVGYGRDGKFYYSDMPAKERAISSAPAPLSLQGAITEGELDPVSIGLSQGGINAFGETPYAQLRRQAEAAGVKDWGLLLGHEQADVLAAHPELQPVYDNWRAKQSGPSSEITQTKYDGLSGIADLAKTDPAGYRAAAGDIAARAAIAYDQAKKDGAIGEFSGPRSPAQQAVDGYYDAIASARDPVTKQVDFDLQDKLGANYLALLDPAVRDKVIKEQAYSRDDTYRAYLTARQTVKPYLDAPDRAFEYAKDFAPGAPPASPIHLLEQYGSLTQFRRDVEGRVRAIIDGINAQGDVQISMNEAESFRQSLEREMGLTDMIDAYRAAVVAVHPEYVPLLNKWYGINQDLIDLSVEVGAAKVR